MAVPSGIANFGGYNYGTRVITIGSDQWTCHNFTVNQPTQKVLGRDNVNLVKRKTLVLDEITGTAEMYIPEGADPPARFATFTEEYDSTIGPVDFVIESVGTPETQSGEKIVNISFGQAEFDLAH